MASIALRRILKLAKKNRVKRSVHIEQELFQVIKRNGLSVSDITNIALERYLKDQGLIQSEDQGRDPVVPCLS